MGTSNYEKIASEYYSNRHITSRNFDSATRAFKNRAKKYLPKNGFALDLGAGKGRAGEYLELPASRVVQVDLSNVMLRFRDREESFGRVQCDALKLPFPSCSFSIVAAFLYDPYNKPLLFREVCRVLTHGGIFIGTLPHFVWGKTLRKIRGYRLNVVRFVTTSGRRMELSSYLSDDSTLSQEIRRVNLDLLLLKDLCIPRRLRNISPDITDPAHYLGLSPSELPVVKLVVAKRE